MNAAGEIRILSVVGARPQFVKLAPVSREIRRRQAGSAPTLDDFIVHTGQHYDAGMSDVFFSELQLPAPSANLGVGSGSHGEQTAKMLAGLESLMVSARPAVVVVYGDTNSTIAGALAAAKLHLPVLHVEAGLRSFNRRMPEEINRVAADHICDRLLAPTQTAIENLARESLADRAVLTGDVMQDAVRFYAAKAEQQSTIRQKLAIESGGYLVATIHRAENTSPRVLSRLLEALNNAARTWLPIVFPIHPRTAAVIRSSLPDWRPDPGVMQIEPLGYLDMLALTANCRCVLTDSGGLQKEAAFVGRPCITLRDETEWTETVTGGANLLAGSDGRMLDECIGRWREVGEDTIARQIATTAARFGDGCAARLIVDEAVALAHASRA